MRWRRSRWRVEAPAATAAATYSRSRRDSTCARTRRTYKGTRTKATARMELPSPGPSAAARAMASTRAGKATMTSITRMRIRSNGPPSQPLKPPRTTPATPASTTTPKPAPMERRPPSRTRANRSRPTSSVPNQWAVEGGCSRRIKSTEFGSCRASQGAITDATRGTRTSSRPTRAIQGRRRRLDAPAVETAEAVEAVEPLEPLEALEAVEDLEDLEDLEAADPARA